MNTYIIHNYNINNYDNYFYDKALKQRYYCNVHYVYKNKYINYKINNIEYELLYDFKNNKLTYLDFNEKYDIITKNKTIY